MTIYRYAPFNLAKLIASRTSYIVKFKNKNPHVNSKIKKVVFVSSSSFQSAREASDCLSLTYQPRHRYLVPTGSFRLRNNEGEDVESEDSADTLATRAWPAFGKAGGGIEYILTPTSNATVDLCTPSYKYMDGGTFDHFHNDAVAPLNDAALKLIAEGVSLVDGYDEGIGAIKNSLPIFKYKLAENCYTISIGYKETPDGFILHIWGSKWKDCGKEKQRLIFCTMENELHYYSKGKDELAVELTHTKSMSFKELRNIVKELAEQMKNDTYRRSYGIGVGYHDLRCVCFHPD